MMRRNYEICPRENHEAKDSLTWYCPECNEYCNVFAPCKGCWTAEAMEQVRGWAEELEGILREYTSQGEIAVNAAADLEDLVSRMVLVAP
jgi:hypothetical protein